METWETIARRHIAELQARLAVVPPPLANKLGLMVPLYAYPGGGTATIGGKFWRDVADAASKFPVTIIANPNSGPGTSPDAAYTLAINQALGAGAKVVGYVRTGYGVRSPEDIHTDVTRWHSFYPGISGIFYDEMATAATMAQFYATLFDSCRAAFPGSIIVGNPGTHCDRAYYDLGRPNVLVLRETAGQAVTLPPWAVSEPDAGFAVLAHATSELAMKAIVSNARNLGIGWLFVTDDALPNPWNNEPSYMASEIASIAATG